ncbi:hypothetical protein BDP27DRAFT_731252 [Rhodocollybia butyracea]|uniref:Nephrocystin 3-like N-terminal domain-containing protein n=1 Tax=Rhodocollybia butyracea TaxID=206335 RepID=A0A9P5PVM3_9AGAR|nr:hypothetical protein BDP27DRAFT_731252 [Rhodocollybia butyracea]
MFNGSHDFTIAKGTFISGDVSISMHDGEKGLNTLYGHTSTSAVFNAEARFPPPQCHPGTRKDILKELKDWVKLDKQQVFLNDSSIRWLYGPAGAGKLAIAQTVAETCAKDGILAGSFFFWRTDPSRNSPEQLFTTLALQIAGTMPELRSIINSVICKYGVYLHVLLHCHRPFISTFRYPSSVEYPHHDHHSHSCLVYLLSFSAACRHCLAGE